MESAKLGTATGAHMTARSRAQRHVREVSTSEKETGWLLDESWPAIPRRDLCCCGARTEGS